MKRQKALWPLYITGILLLGLANCALAQKWNPSHSIGTVSGNYNYQYNQTPDQLVEIHPATLSAGTLTYQWFSSPTLNDNDFQFVSGGQNYSPGPLLQTTYFKRRTLNSSGAFIWSNVIKLSVVSANWEDRNYIREHDVQVPGITTWQAVDQLPIGDKFQMTTYLDGLGRSVQATSRETATPTQAGGLWSDVVQFTQYDEFGRQSKKYLAYTTATESGKFKTTASSEQSQYYSNVFNETSPFAEIIFEPSPLNRKSKEKDAGFKWASSGGRETNYDVNSIDENVQQFEIDYVKGSAPVSKGPYPANSLYKNTYIDKTEVVEKKVIEYYDKAGQLILKKVQLDDVPSVAHAGWICTYSVYDDKGLLRYQLQPEAVKYLDANNWSFAGTEGQQVLSGLCYQYYYDEKGRTTWKKSPGTEPLSTLYDSRDRIIFTQDGNQAALTTPQWTASLFDELDRLVITTLYNTTKTTAALQTDIDNAITISPGSSSSNQVTGTDLIINQRQTNIVRYAATNSIQFVSDATGSFESAANDEFLAEIDPNAGQNNSVTTTAFISPITAADLNNPNISTILKYNFYDDYSFASVKAFNTGFTNLSAYSTSDPKILPIATSKRTLGWLTGSMVRVLGSNMFLSTTVYYDEERQLIQSLEDNVKGGVDINTQQYHYDGRLMSRCSDHTANGTGNTNFITLTKNNFDKLGRITSVDKQFGSNAFKTVATYEFDDIGRLKSEHLDPTYTTDGKTELESLGYSYNLHGELVGINKDYALKNPANYDKWAHFFGMYLGFDNRDNVFGKSRLNGQVAGVLWNTQGDDAQRKYEYTYDNADRLIQADFTEQKHPGEGWTNNKMDFSVGGSGGKITYDLNGNLLSMLQKGVIPGTAAPVTIDDLAYAYGTHSNKLQSVTDNTPLNSGSLNGMFGDFKDGANGTAPDYVYDNNGNLVIDLNKNAKDLENVAGANGISYNYLDKPEKIRIAGKGTIRIVYSANGEKLQRAFIPESGAPATITTYINQFVYEEKAVITTTIQPPFAAANADLSFINFEEGRIRIIQPVAQDNGLDGVQIAGNISLPNGKAGVFDYFIKDYQENTRMVLTEEVHNAYNTCTMETGRATIEDPVFGQTGSANEVETTRHTVPSGWQNTNIGSSVSQLGNLAGHNIGPNTLQKVMAGDKVSATAQYYYQTANGGRNPNFLNTILTSLGQAIAGSGTASDIVKANITPISSQLNATNGFINAVQPASDGSNTPQAYLTILFFDERFNFIEAADGGVAQQQVAGSVGSSGASLGLGSIKAPKNGYAYVYVSNISDQDVYFDNLQVGIVRGNIIEENHYYAYGLKIAAISSRKAADVNEGKLKNDYLYNDKEFFDDADLNLYDYGFRNYDPQIGRFVQSDPIAAQMPALSGYHYAYNDPVTNVDADGLIGIPCPGTSALGIFFMKAGEVIGNSISVISKFTPWISIAGNIANIGTGAYNQSVTTKIINQQLVGSSTQQVGSTGNESNSLGAGTDSYDDSEDKDPEWQPLYKADLALYYKQTHGREGTDNDLGDEFEDIFEDYIDNAIEAKLFKYETRVRRYDDGKITGGRRNTVPDFIGDVLVLGGKKLIVRIKGSDWFELKQKSGGLYLSSNDDQIRGHINNLRRTSEYAYQKYRKCLYKSKFWLITTADVKFSPGIAEHARSRNVLYEHVHAEYRIVKGKWQFRFSKSVGH